MNVDATEENERAVRILGYNSQEITPDAIDKIKAVYEKVHNVIAKMTPARTLDLIRDGINPLQTNLEELEDKLDINPLTPVEEAERYSHFLYRMEQSGKISEDEKESFIGIYRMINAIEKDDGAAIGTLIAANGDINFKNLVSAVRTRNNKGIDAKIDDEFGGLKELKFKDKSITEQIEKAFSANDNLLEDRYVFDEREKNYIHENANEIRENGDIDQDIINFLTENKIALTNDNLQAAKEISVNRGKIYKDIAKLSEKSTLKSKNVNKNVDNQDANASNVDKTTDFTSDFVENILESFDEPASAKAAYSDMINNIDTMLNTEAMNAGAFIDLKEIVSSMKRMSIVRDLYDNECYEVPAYIDGELTSVRVSLLHNENMVPNVNLKVFSENFGNVGASFGLIDGKIEGMIVCDSEEGMSKVKMFENTFIGSLNEEVSRVSYFKSSNTDVNYFASRTDKLNSTDNSTSNGFEVSEGKDAISTKALYKIAKEFMKSFA